MEHELFHYLEYFMKCSYWDDEKTPEQARAIFTTLCFMDYIDVDTSKCDNILHRLYNETAMEDFMEYDEFEAFMIELIV